MYIYYGLIPYYTMQEEPLPLSNLIRSHVSMESTRMKESSGFLRLRLCSGHTSLVYPGIPEQPHRSCQLEAGFFTIQSVRLKRVIISYKTKVSKWNFWMNYASKIVEDAMKILAYQLIFEEKN